jgi:hypothetical protein
MKEILPILQVTALQRRQRPLGRLDEVVVLLAQRDDPRQVLGQHLRILVGTVARARRAKRRSFALDKLVDHVQAIVGALTSSKEGHSRLHIGHEGVEGSQFLLHRNLGLVRRAQGMQHQEDDVAKEALLDLIRFPRYDVLGVDQ